VCVCVCVRVCVCVCVYVCMYVCVCVCMCIVTANWLGLPLITGLLVAAGASDTIRIWDVDREQCTLDMPSMTETGAVAVSSSWDGNIVAGNVPLS